MHTNTQQTTAKAQHTIGNRDTNKQKTKNGTLFAGDKTVVEHTTPSRPTFYSLLGLASGGVISVGSFVETGAVGDL